MRYAPPGFVPSQEAGKLEEAGIAKADLEAVDANPTILHPLKSSSSSSSSKGKKRSNKTSKLIREEEERKKLSKSKRGKAGKESTMMRKKTNIGNSDVHLFKDVDLHLTDPSEVQQTSLVKLGTSKTAENRSKKKAVRL